MNKCILVGNVGQDAELKTSASGFSVLKFTLATTDKWKSQDGEEKSKTCWHRISVLGKRAEGLAPHITKGLKLLVEGKIVNDVVEKDGAKVTYSSVEVGMDGQIEFLTPKGDGGEFPPKPRDTQRNLPAQAADKGPIPDWDSPSV